MRLKDLLALEHDAAPPQLTPVRAAKVHRLLVELQRDALAHVDTERVAAAQRIVTLDTTTGRNRNGAQRRRSRRQSPIQAAQRQCMAETRFVLFDERASATQHCQQQQQHTGRGATRFAHQNPPHKAMIELGVERLAHSQTARKRRNVGVRPDVALHKRRQCEQIGRLLAHHQSLFVVIQIYLFLQTTIDQLKAVVAYAHFEAIVELRDGDVVFRAAVFRRV